MTPVRALTVAAAVAAGLLLSLLGPSGPESTAADGELKVQISQVDISHFPQVTFVARILDPSGKSVTGLSPGDFSVDAGGTPIAVKNVQSITDAKVGTSTLIAVQASGGMYGQPIAAVRQAAGQYVQSLQPVDEVGVVAFASKVQPLSAINSDFGRAQAAIGQLTAFGDTALYQAVVESATEIAARPNSQRFVILISDGIDFGSVSKVTRSQAIDAARVAGVPFYVIGFPGFVNTSLPTTSTRPGTELDRDFLQAIADASGGQLFLAPSANQLGTAFAQLSEFARAKYIITLDATGLQGDTNAIVTARQGAQNGQAEIRLSLPNIPVPIAVPPPLARSGGSSTWVIFLVLLIVVALPAYLLSRRIMARRARFQLPPPTGISVFDGNDRPVEEKEAPVARPVVANLHLASGENFPLRGDVVTLGVDPDSTFRLPITPTEFGGGRVRVWLARERFIIHDDAPRTRVRVNGRPQSWSVLADGDELEIRTLKLRFERAPENAAAAPQEIGV